MKFSIVIPVRQINDFLIENIQNLKKLNYKDFEVIIVVDALQEYNFDDNRFRLVESGEKDPGEKRNTGVRESTGDIVVFLDDDAYPQRDWLNKAKEVFEETKTYALGGPAVTPKNAPLKERCSGFVLESIFASANTTYRHTPSKRRSIDDYPTVNLFVGKNEIMSVGGFKSEFWPGEDTKLCLDLVKKYGKFIYDPSPVVYHHRRTLFKPHLKQISRYGRHRGQFARIYPETSRLPLYFIPSLFVLGLTLGPIISTFIPLTWYLYNGTLILYITLLLSESLQAAIKDKNASTFVYVALGIFLTQIVYGVNFMIGFIKKPKLKLKRIDIVTGNYAEG